MDGRESRVIVVLFMHLFKTSWVTLGFSFYIELSWSWSTRLFYFVRLHTYVWVLRLIQSCPLSLFCGERRAISSSLKWLLLPQDLAKDIILAAITLVVTV